MRQYVCMDVNVRNVYFGAYVGKYSPTYNLHANRSTWLHTQQTAFQFKYAIYCDI